ncbi:MAG: hypothetical protein RIS94_743 [Pseudomonadota bacterium]|jgi:hypothetical protein
MVRSNSYRTATALATLLCALVAPMPARADPFDAIAFDDATTDIAVFEGEGMETPSSSTAAVSVAWGLPGELAPPPRAPQGQPRLTRAVLLNAMPAATGLGVMPDLTPLQSINGFDPGLYGPGWAVGGANPAPEPASIQMDDAPPPILFAQARFTPRALPRIRGGLLTAAEIKTLIENAPLLPGEALKGMPLAELLANALKNPTHVAFSRR